MRFYDYASCVISDELLKQATFYSRRLWKFKAILDLRQVQTGFEVEISWENGEISWEPLSEILESSPDITREFLKHGVPPGSKQVLAALDAIRKGGVTAPQGRSRRSGLPPAQPSGNKGSGASAKRR